LRRASSGFCRFQSSSSTTSSTSSSTTYSIPRKPLSRGMPTASPLGPRQCVRAPTGLHDGRSGARARGTARQPAPGSPRYPRATRLHSYPPAGTGSTLPQLYAFDSSRERGGRNTPGAAEAALPRPPGSHQTVPRLGSPPGTAATGGSCLARAARDFANRGPAGCRPNARSVKTRPFAHRTRTAARPQRVRHPRRGERPDCELDAHRSATSTGSGILCACRQAMLRRLGSPSYLWHARRTYAVRPPASIY